MSRFEQVSRFEKARKEIRGSLMGTDLPLADPSNRDHAKSHLHDTLLRHRVAGRNGIIKFGKGYPEETSRLVELYAPQQDQDAYEDFVYGWRNIAFQMPRQFTLATPLTDSRRDLLGRRQEVPAPPLQLAVEGTGQLAGQNYLLESAKLDDIPAVEFEVREVGEEKLTLFGRIAMDVTVDSIIAGKDGRNLELASPQHQNRTLFEARTYVDTESWGGWSLGETAITSCVTVVY